MHPHHPSTGKHTTMTPSPTEIARIAAIGIAATAILDAWIWALARAGVPGTNFAFIGRWIGHLGRGRWRHAAISKAAPVPHESALGWLTHYAVGIGFAAMTAGALGLRWLQAPRLLPALAAGVATVVFPFFLMQPAMGAGIASCRTPTPGRNRLRSLANHAVFGAGLYLAASVLALLSN
jgi:hypothetical protein